MKPISDNVLVACAVLVSVCVVAMSAVLFFANIGSRWADGAAIGVVAVAWIARRFASARRDVTISLVMAGALLLVALAAKALAHVGWAASSDLAVRTNGVMIGAILILFSNAIPKRMSSASERIVRRNIGTAFVLGGFGYACAWLALPLRFASDAAIIIMLAALLIALVSYIRGRRACDETLS